MSAKPPRKKEPQPNPDVTVGDEVYFQHGKGPQSAKVAATGRHGITVHHENKHHRVKWEHVLGHKSRIAQKYNVLDEGEDGLIVADEKGQRRYINVPPEARGEKMVLDKSFSDTGRIVFFAKAGPIANRPGLSLQEVTDKNGGHAKHWVRTTKDTPSGKPGGGQPQPATPPKHVGFQNGEHKGHGRVIATGEHGHTVEDAAGGKHRVPHDAVTHEWHHDDEPDSSPHDDAPKKPNYEPRMEGEDDKKYAKRVIDKGDSVDKLPEDHDKYFNTKDAKHVPLSNLHSTKSDEENQQGGDNGPKRMQAAYHGVLGKRDPIKVMPHETKDGHFEVVDGNGTLTSAKKMGWSGLPTQQVSREEGLVSMMEDELKDAVKDAGMAELYAGDGNESLPAKASSKFKTWEEISGAIDEGQKQLESIIFSAGAAMGGEKVGRFDEYDYSKKGTIFGLGSPKKLDSAKRKVDSKYGGDWSKLCDVVRGSIGFDTVEEMKAGIEKLKAAGLKLASKPDNKFIKPTDAGYRDMNLNFVLPNGLVGELQMHLKPILMAKSEGHKDYEMTRLIDAKAKNNPPLTDEEEKELASRLLKQRSLYGNAMKQALGGTNKKTTTLAKSLKNDTMSVLFFCLKGK